MINVGFIGLGGMGRFQVKTFQQAAACRIAAGFDPSAEARAEFAKQAPDAKVYSDQQDLLNDAKVDAMVIAVPTGHHMAAAIDAMKAGRNVLVEKPMARTVAECRRMIAVSEKTKRLLMVGHCRRYDLDWGTFAKLFRAGKLGPEVLWRDVRAGRGPGRWYMDDALGGGPLLDGAAHNVDFANYLFGEPESVSGSHIKLDHKVTAVDTASAVVRYKNGSQVLLSWSWASPGQSVRDVLGSKASMVFGLNGLTAPDGKTGHCLLDKRGEKKLVTFDKKDMWLEQAKHFLKCVDGKAECQSPGSECWKTVAVCNAMLKACRDGAARKIEL
jgi:predicted dehydrogenase